MLRAADVKGKDVRVVVNYTGRDETGEVFDRSSDWGQPFAFLLGHGQAIKGFDAAVATMCIGEEASITIRADYAYGVAGKPPKIPPHATLSFDLELISAEASEEPTANDTAEGMKALTLTGDSPEDQSQTLIVGGNPVKVDHLG